MKRSKAWVRMSLAAAAAGLVLYAAAAGVQLLRADWTREKPEITVVIKTVKGMEFWDVLTDGVETAAKEFDVDVRVTGPMEEWEVDKQIDLVREAITAKSDAIVLAATHYERLEPLAEQIREAGIPLVTVDSRVEGDAALSFIATDNAEAGRKAGDAMAELLTAGEKVAVISYVRGTSTQIEREEGVRASLEAHGLEWIGTYYCNGSIDKAYEIAAQLLEEHGDLGGIIGLNEPSAAGAGKAIRDAGKAGAVKLIGFDHSIEEVKQLEEGVMQATVVQRPFNMGYLSVRTAAEALRGKQVPKEIDTGSVVITKQNMYTDEHQKLLFPFVEE